ncbi:MAG: phosphopantothenoylcysteine decarboxylase [Isosphaeraceae bacterium]
MNVVVTGGGTVAPIDEVRTITNSSSGRFSAALTEGFLRLGAEVWHVHAPKAVLPFRRSAAFDLDGDDAAREHARLDRLREEYRDSRERLHLVPVPSGTVQDYSATLETVLLESAVDMAVLAMAVSDYEPDPVAGKIDSSGDHLVIHCRKTPKVIRSVKDWAPGVFLVGFKLLAGSTTEELIGRAERACVDSRADVTVANDQRTLREGRHTVHLVRPGRPAETFGPGERMADDVARRLTELARASRLDPALRGPV